VLKYAVSRWTAYGKKPFLRGCVMKNCWIRVILILAVVVICGIGFSVEARGWKVKIFVSIVPQKYFVEKIGGELVDVSVMVLPGNSPATYEPKPKQMVSLSGTKVYYVIGVPFERIWLKKITAINPKMLLVHTETGIEKAHMNADKREGIKDPHIWLSPPLVMVQASNILSGLLKVDPGNSSIYKKNYKKFIMEMVDLDVELREIFLGKEGASFMVFHPAWGYFARTYGLKMVPIESEGKEPKPAALHRLIKKAKEHDINVVFVQPEFSVKSAKIIAKEIGGQVAFASPLALNWKNNLKEVAVKFKAAFR
jgi:zinc transport system substrate-binding protein